MEANNGLMRGVRLLSSNHFPTVSSLPLHLQSITIEETGRPVGKEEQWNRGACGQAEPVAAAGTLPVHTFRHIVDCC